VSVLEDINVTMKKEAQNQTTWAKAQQFAFMSVILGALLFLAVFVYIPLERRIKRLVDALVVNNSDITRFANNLNILTQLSPHGIFRVDRGGHLTYVNDRWRNIVGYSTMTPLKDLDSWMTRIHKDDRAGVDQAWTDMISNPSQSVSFEFRVLRPRIVLPEPVEQAANGDDDDDYYRDEDEEDDGDVYGNHRLNGSSPVGGVELRPRKIRPVPLASPVDPNNSDYEIRWILFQCQPEVTVTEYPTQTTRIHSVVGSLADVTDQRKLEKEKMDALALAASQAEEHRAEQARFVDIICHEIRNPLNGIVNSADVLRAVHHKVRSSISALHNYRRSITAEEAKVLYQNLEDTQDLWDAMELCVNHQRRITEDVLQVSRLRVGRFSIVTCPMSLHSTVDTVVRMFQAEATANGIALISRYLPACERVPRVKCDPQRLVQVLINLVGNAIKFTKETLLRTVTVEVDVDGLVPSVGQLAQIVFRVSDTGIGLSEDERAKLFVPFGQANVKTYSKYGGSGMGLFISKALLDLMGGTIRVDSKEGQGCTFTVVVPCERLADSTTLGELRLNLDPNSAARVGASSPGTPTTSMGQPSHQGTPVRSPPLLAVPLPMTPAAASVAAAAAQFRVLVVEDNDINQRILKKQLAMVPEGIFYVEGASDGQQAVDLFVKHTYDLVMMDVEMPVMGGLEATKLIREHEARANARKPAIIIGLSGNARDEHVQAGHNSGMNDYLSKPYRKPELFACVARNLRFDISILGPLD